MHRQWGDSDIRAKTPQKSEDRGAPRPVLGAGVNMTLSAGSSAPKACLHLLWGKETSETCPHRLRAVLCLIFPNTRHGHGFCAEPWFTLSPF